MALGSIRSVVDTRQSFTVNCEAHLEVVFKSWTSSEPRRIFSPGR